MDVPILENMHFLIPENVDIPISQTQFQRVDIDSLDYDPGTRKQIWEYHVNQRDEIRRAYIKKGPHQPPKIFFFFAYFRPPKLEILRSSLFTSNGQYVNLSYIYEAHMNFLTPKKKL